MKKRIFIVFLAAILMLTLMAPASAAEPTQAIKDVFNAAQLTPRQSTNPTIAKYVESIMRAIDPEGKLSTYEKAEKAYQWVRKNIAFEARYLDNFDATYMEGAALYGFENKKGPCEVDSATLLYLLRYIGLNAQWVRGERDKSLSPSYHIWTEVLMGDTAYVFDPYHGIETSFAARKGTELGKTVVNGFTHIGFIKCYTEDEAEATTKVEQSGNTTTTTTSYYLWKTFYEGNMDRMRRIYPATISLTKSFNDGTPSFTCSFRAIGEERIALAGIDKFIEPSGNADHTKSVFGAVAGKTLTAYTIKVGTKINIAGMSAINASKLVMKNGKLQGAGAGLIEWDTETEWDDLPRTEIPVGNGKTYTVSPKGSYISFTKEGFYLVDPLPFHAAFVNTEPSSSGFLWPNPNNALRYGYALLHVVK